MRSPEVVVPAQFRPQLSGGPAIGRVHELDVLNMLFCGAIQDRSDRLRHMIVSGEPELVECGEEMIVSRFFCAAPVAHRPGVDDLVIENVVVIGAADRGLGRVVLTGIAGRSEQAGSRPVDAHVVGGRPVDDVFGVERAVEMVVQVPALRHLLEESQQ